VFPENKFLIFKSMLKNVRRILLFEQHITNKNRKEQKGVFQLPFPYNHKKLIYPNSINQTHTGQVLKYYISCSIRW
jgi:hypothetical protein